MKLDAEKHGPALYAGEGDSRMTKVGRFLRDHHLDELPPVSYTHLDVYKRQVLVRGNVCRASWDVPYLLSTGYSGGKNRLLPG